MMAGDIDILPQRHILTNVNHIIYITLTYFNGIQSAIPTLFYYFVKTMPTLSHPYNMRSTFCLLILCLLPWLTQARAATGTKAPSHWTIKLTPNFPIVEPDYPIGPNDIADGYFELEADIDLDYKSTGFNTYNYDIAIDLWVQPGYEDRYVKLLDEGDELILRNVGKGKSKQTLKLPWNYVKKAQQIAAEDMSDWSVMNKIYFTSRDASGNSSIGNPNTNADIRKGYFYIPMSKLKGRIPSFAVLADEFAAPFGDSTTGIRFEYHFFDTPQYKWTGKYTGSLGIGLQFSSTPDFDAENIAVFLSKEKTVLDESNYCPEYFTSAAHPEYGAIPQSSAIDKVYTSAPRILRHPSTTFLQISDYDTFFKNLPKLLDTDEVYVRMIAWLPELNKTGVIGSDNDIPDLPIQQVSANVRRLHLDSNGYWLLDNEKDLPWIDNAPVHYDMKFPTRKYWEGKYARWRRADGISRYKPERILTRKHNTAGGRNDLLPPDAITGLDTYPYSVSIGNDSLGIQATRCGRGSIGENSAVEIEYVIKNLNTHPIRLSLLADNDSTRFAISQGELLTEIYSGVAPDFDMQKGNISISLQPDSCVIVRHSAVDNLFWASDRINVLMPVKIGSSTGYIPLRNMLVSRNEGLEEYEQTLFDGDVAVQLTGLSHGGEIRVDWEFINNTPRPIALRINPEQYSLTTNDGKTFSIKNGLQLYNDNSYTLILNQDGSVFDKNKDPDTFYIGKYGRMMANATTTEAGEDVTTFTMAFELTDGKRSEKVVFKDVPITYTGYTFNPDEDVEYEE